MYVHVTHYILHNVCNRHLLSTLGRQWEDIHFICQFTVNPWMLYLLSVNSYRKWKLLDFSCIWVGLCSMWKQSMQGTFFFFFFKLRERKKGCICSKDEESIFQCEVLQMSKTHLQPWSHYLKNCENIKFSLRLSKQRKSLHPKQNFQGWRALWHCTYDNT